MTHLIARRSFLTGLLAGLAAPAVVSAANLMPVSAAKLLLPDGWVPVYGWRAHFVIKFAAGWEIKEPIEWESIAESEIVHAVAQAA